MADVVFIVLCERCLLDLPGEGPFPVNVLIEKCGGLRDPKACPRCGPIERVRMIPVEDEALQKR
jgi:hypothetical protein